MEKNPTTKKSDLLTEVLQHYKMWNDDNKKRMTRKHGWNEITDAYYGKLPDDWPYTSKVVDPKIRTTLIEKNARLLNAKLRGRLIPRESGDQLGAILNNAVLDFQWDNANDGGPMLTKFSITDMDTRLYGSKFAYVYWKYELDEDGKVIFDGNELMPLDIRDCGMDSSPACTHIRNAEWFQFRSWELLEDLENATDAQGKPLYKNLSKVRTAIAEKASLQRSSTRNEYTPRIKQLQGLEDRTGQDLAFPVVKKVVEFRKNKWITFLPDYDVIIHEAKNPYNHGKIPIAQLRYYPLQDEPLGESEVESVLGIWLAIQATICGYMDEVIQNQRPPLKIIENAARIETIAYGADQQWLVDRLDAVEQVSSNGESLRYFQTTYQALLSAFNVAMGDISQQTSNVDPFAGANSKTATEIKASVNQQNSRDQKNQNDLAEFIKDIMMMWLENNKQFLFSDPTKQEYILRIVGKEKFNQLQQLGLDQETVLPETMAMIGDIIKHHPEMSDAQQQMLYDAGKMPMYPIVINPKEKNPEKVQLKPKMTVEGNMADIIMVPKDLEGTYDYIPDVKSMALGAGDTLIQSRQRAIDRLTTNQIVLDLLASEGYKPQIKELLVDDFEDTGLNDADKYFTKVETQTATPQMGGSQPNMQVGGLPNAPQANPGGSVQQPMAGPIPGDNGSGVPQAVQGPMGQGNGLQGAL